MEFFLRKFSLSIICSVISLIFLSSIAYAEFYKYVDENGVQHFVDNYGNIPEKYRQQEKIYKEKYDHLSEQEEKERLRQDRLENERLMDEQRLLEDNYIQGMEVIDKEREDQLAKETKRKNSETAVTIRDGQVLVPVSIGYLNRQVNITLLLDTGATHTVIHKNIAEQLHIGRAKTSQAMLAGGQIINTTEADLDFITVGPKKIEDLNVSIMDYVGPPVPHDGLLGMNFLQNFDYSIDIENSIIQWGE